MLCHYEVLNLPQDASSEDLKKAYRKLVLQWHPDKNLSNTQECKEKFQLIQQAYDILSDPQERAWYDKHREEILKGGENYKDDSLNVFQYFTTSCYCGFEDDDKGFFSVYRSIFEKLAAEDTPFMDQEELMPSFGGSKSSYAEVVHIFYGHWQSYCTAKTYVWIEAYDIREAPNRRVLRLMEKENKKLRDQARKARNEEVRALVAFVRKRDPRVQAQKKILEEKKAENMRKAEEQRQKAILDRRQELSRYNECEWSNMSKLENDLQQIESQLDNQFGRDSETEEDDCRPEEEADDAEELLIEDSRFCIACDKIFQSEKAKLNHDQSKKHKENVTLLKQALEEDDLLTSSDQQATDLPPKCQTLDTEGQDIEEEASLKESESDLETSPIQTKTKISKSSRKKKKAVLVAESDLEVEDLELEKVDVSKVTEDELPSKPDSKLKKKRRRAKQSKDADTVPEVVEEAASANAEGEKLLCATCGTLFPSRNKLFNHLKTTKHSVYLEEKVKLMYDSSEKPEKGKKGRTRNREL